MFILRLSDLTILAQTKLLFSFACRSVTCGQFPGPQKSDSALGFEARSGIAQFNF